MADSIKCPQCRAEIPLSEVISHQIEEQLSAELARSFAERERELKEEAEARERALTEAADERVAELRREFETAGAAREKEIEEKVEAKVATELADLRTRTAEQDDALRAARERELEFIQERRRLDERAEAMDLEVARRTAEERQKIASDARSQAAEEHKLDLREKDLAIEQMQRQIAELKESSEQTRAGLVGEAQEREIEDTLDERFRTDLIESVKAGQRGADVLQTVVSRRGEKCGKILWESKRAQNWSNNWIPKLKADQAAAGADLAVLVCSALPRDVRHMELIDGVWVVSFACVIPIASSLRETLIGIAQARSIDANRTESLSQIYDYLTSNEFSRHIRAIVEGVITLKDGLDQERRSMEKIWSNRAKQIDALTLNTAAIYGDLEAIVGPALPTIEKLELTAPVLPIRSAS